MKRYSYDMPDVSICQRFSIHFVIFFEGVVNGDEGKRKKKDR